MQLPVLELIKTELIDVTEAMRKDDICYALRTHFRHQDNGEEVTFDTLFTSRFWNKTSLFEHIKNQESLKQGFVKFAEMGAINVLMQIKSSDLRSSYAFIMN